MTLGKKPSPGSDVFEIAIDTIIARDDLGVLKAYFEHFIIGGISARSVVGLCILHDAISILKHYVKPVFEHSPESRPWILGMLFNTGRPGACLEWFWENHRSIIQENFQSLIKVSIRRHGLSQYSLIVWCMQHGARLTQTDMNNIEENAAEQPHTLTPADISAIETIRQLYAAQV